MKNLPLPTLRLMPESQLGNDSWHSILISALRGMAALQVVAAHLRADFFPGLRTIANPSLWYQALAFFTGFSHQAVLVFFLISGWLVGGSLLNKLGQPHAIQLYAIDRVSRLWTVLVPTLLLTLAFGIVTGVLDPHRPDFSTTNPFSATVFAGNLAGLQRISVPEFGGNFPLWSLANETWYYLLFPLLVLMLAGREGMRMLPGAMLVLALLLLPFSITLYFSIWLLGAVFSRVRLECSAQLRVGLILLLSALSVFLRLTGGSDDMAPASYPQYLLLSVLLVLLLSSTVVKADPRKKHVARIKATATFLSNFSFSLYVVHIPVMGMLGWLGLQILGSNQLDANNLVHLGIYGAMLAAVVVFAYGFYSLFEAHTWQVRRWLKGILPRPPLPGRRTAPADY